VGEGEGASPPLLSSCIVPATLCLCRLMLAVTAPWPGAQRQRLLPRESTAVHAARPNEPVAALVGGACQPPLRREYCHGVPTPSG